jgi:hypothetical protein
VCMFCLPGSQRLCHCKIQFAIDILELVSMLATDAFCAFRICVCADADVCVLMCVCVLV